MDDGRVVFVPFVAAGETVRVEVVREHKSYLEARLLAVETPSPRRVAPPCPYFGRCGGCSYQHLDAEEQRDTKRRQVESVLRRIGKLEGIVVDPTVPSPLEYHYRNRITVHADEDGAVGFFGQDRDRNRALIDIAQCPIAEESVNAALTRFRANPRRRAGHCTLRADTGHSGGFAQTNDGAAAELLALVTRRLFPAEVGAAPASTSTLIDAYCGAGFFARHLRERFAQVVGLEWDRRAVAQARRDAAPHERYLDGDVATLLPEALAAVPLDTTTLIVDPPAEGLANPVRRAILATPSAGMIYVSCNPATLARDLAALGASYQILSVTPLDMFPQTAEIEVVASVCRATTRSARIGSDCPSQPERSPELPVVCHRPTLARSKRRPPPVRNLPRRLPTRRGPAVAGVGGGFCSARLWSRFCCRWWKSRRCGLSIRR